MPYPKNKDFHSILEKLDSRLARELPFCIYRKPQEHVVTAVLQSDDKLNKITDYTEKGFVFAPFNLEEGSVLIRPDEIIRTSFDAEPTFATKQVDLSNTDKAAHKSLVSKGIAEIKSGNLKKVVLSRKIEVSVETRPTEIFKNLLQRYPNAFCYLFHHPKVGTWCGATPETLVWIKNGELRTMSLAATLPFIIGEEPKWGIKEVEEQKMVSDYIKERLYKIADELHIGKAESVKAGNLWHLRSEVNGKLSSGTKVKEVITSLHPTSAICGIPFQNAKDFIHKNENYRRSFYTGFLGELNLQSNDKISLFVNLRCMELHQDSAAIFVGGGITSASVPENEWIETQNKSKTMLDIL